MTPSLLRRWTTAPQNSFRRGFRSKAALEALEEASNEKTPTIALYNYPSFSGAFSALFARLFHSHLRLPCLILPFSSVEPLRSIRTRSFVHILFSSLFLCCVGVFGLVCFGWFLCSGFAWESGPVWLIIYFTTTHIYTRTHWHALEIVGVCLGAWMGVGLAFFVD